MWLATPPPPPTLRVGPPGREHAARSPCPPHHRWKTSFLCHLQGHSFRRKSADESLPGCGAEALSHIHWWGDGSASPQVSHSSSSGCGEAPGGEEAGPGCVHSRRGLRVGPKVEQVPLGSHLALWGLSSPGPGAHPRTGCSWHGLLCLSLGSSSLPASSSGLQGVGGGTGEMKSGVN